MARLFHETIYCGGHLLATTLEFDILVLDIRYRYASGPKCRNAAHLAYGSAPLVTIAHKIPGPREDRLSEPAAPSISTSECFKVTAEQLPSAC